MHLLDTAFSWRNWRLKASILLLASTTLASAADCNLYPIALSSQSLSNVAPGTVVADILNGTAPGNFGWLTWGGSPSEPTLVTSLTAPGNSGTYVNPDNTADHQVNIGDWVRGKPGVSNAKPIRGALDFLTSLEISVPVWDQARNEGGKTEYRVATFAKIRLLSYQLPGQNRITARFLGYVTCGADNAAPLVSAGPAQSAVYPNPITLQGSASDDGLPADGTLTVQWSVVSGPGVVTLGNSNSAITTVTFSTWGEYVLRLTGTDGELTSADEVTITIVEPNRPPQAISKSVTTAEDVSIAIVLEATDPDPGDELTFTLLSSPSHGSLSGSPPNLVLTAG